jgi:hypothetical protein
LARASCQPGRHSRIVASTRHSIAWVERHRNSGGDRTFRWFACLRSSTGRVLVYTNFKAGRFGPQGFTSAPTNFRLAGRYVAFGANTLDRYGSGSQFIEVFDLRRRRLTLRLDLHDYSNGDPTYSFFNFQQLAVSARGFVAWQQVEVTQSHQVVGSIDAHDSAGTRRLDAGGPNDFSGLHIVGETVEWSNRGIPKSAQLA